MATVLRDVEVAHGAGRTEPHVDVVIEDGRIAALMPTGRPHDGDLIGVHGGFLAPGLVDGHVHFDRHDRELNETLALSYLAYGVTSVMCLYGTPAILSLRDAVAAGRAVGPRVWTTGPAQNDARLSYAQGLASAQEQAQLGYDAIKIYNDLSEPGFRGLQDGARAAGMPVVGHVARSVGLTATLEAGQSHIAHLEELLYTYLGVSVDGLLSGQPEHLDRGAARSLARELVRRGVSVGTTVEALVVAGRQVNNAANWCARPDVAGLPDRLRQTWLPPTNFYANAFPERAHVGLFTRLTRLAVELAVVLKAEGVELVVGSDALNCGVPPGTSFRRELRYLIQGGLSNLDAFASALTPFDLDEPSGERIAVGRPADLIVLTGNPYESVTRLDGLRHVVAQGNLHPVRAIKQEIKARTARLNDAPASLSETPHESRSVDA